MDWITGFHYLADGSLMPIERVQAADRCWAKTRGTCASPLRSEAVEISLLPSRSAQIEVDLAACTKSIRNIHISCAHESGTGTRESRDFATLSPTVIKSLASGGLEVDDLRSQCSEQLSASVKARTVQLKTVPRTSVSNDTDILQPDSPIAVV